MDVPAGAGPGAVVFVSYSHADVDWLQRLLVLLQPYVRDGRVHVWADPYIRVGEDWQRVIGEAVEQAAAALLLVSGDFLASSFIMDVELPALQARGVRLVPVLVHECAWDVEPVLRRVQWAHDPGREGPLDRDADRPGERDRRLVEVCRTLVAGLEGDDRPVARPSSSRTGRWSSRAPVHSLAPAATGAALDGVPALPPGFVRREELAGLRSAVLDVGSAAVGLTGKVSGVGLSGQGGIGKSVLAAALARDIELGRFFPDGVFWVTVGEGADLRSVQVDLLVRLGVRDPEVRSISQGVQLLREVMADRRCLLVVDDVWSAAGASALAVTGPHGRLLYTARDPAVLEVVGARIEQVGVLSDAAARALLAEVSGTDLRPFEEQVQRVLDGTGRVALALALVGAAMRGGRRLEDLAEGLEAGRLIYGDHPYANAFKALQLAVDALDRDTTAAYMSLAVYPPDTAVPVLAVVRLWDQLHGYSEPRTRAVVAALAGRSLLTVTEQDTVGLHDLQHDFLKLRAQDLLLLHSDLLHAYRALLPRGEWWQLPISEPYVWNHVLHHLAAAGEVDELARVATDPAFLVARCFQGGPQSAEADLRLAEQVAPSTQVRWWLLWLRQYGHLLTALPRLSDVAVTALSRLGDVPDDVPVRRLQPLLPERYLAVRWGLPTETTALRRVLTGHADAVSAVVFSPDGSQLATSSWDGTVRLWDVRTSTETAVLTDHTDRVSVVVFSPGGSQLASAGYGGSVLLWDPATGVRTAVLTGHSGRVRVVVFSPDGSQLASGSDDGTVRLWDPSTGALTGVLTGHTGRVSAVVYSPDGSRLATASEDDGVRLWETATGTRTAVLAGHTSWVSAVGFSPDGRQCATGGRDGTVRLWDPASDIGRAVLTGHTGAVSTVVYSPDGSWLATAGDDGTVRLWNPDTGTETAALTGHTGWVSTVLFSAEGGQLASAGDDGSVRLWDAATGVARAVLTGHTGWVTALAFSPEGSQIATAGEDGTVRLWEPSAAAEQTPLAEHTAVVTALTFSPGGDQLASGSSDGTVRLWDPGTGTWRTVSTSHSSGVSALAFSPDGSRLASASWDGSVRLWEPATGARSAVLGSHAEGLSAVAFSPDGSRLASGSDNGTVRLWGLATGTASAVLTGHTLWVGAVVFSPDGGRLASASDDGTVRLWRSATGTVAAVLTGHTGGASAVAFRPDGSSLVSAGADGTVRLWDPGTGTETAVLVGHTGSVTAAAFSRDGNHVVSTSDDGTVRVWTMRTPAPPMVIRIGRGMSDLAWLGNVGAIGFRSSPVLLEVRDRTPGP